MTSRPFGDDSMQQDLVSSTVMNVLRISSITALAAASLAAVPFSASAAQEASALTRIEAAFQEGRIDAPTRALYGLYLMKDHSQLPANLRPTDSEEPLRCGTFLWQRALSELGAMSPAQQAEYAMVGSQRPTVPANQTLTSTIYELQVHYVDLADEALAGDVFAYAELSWEAEVETMGWRAPVLDSGAQGSTDLDVYIAPTGFGGAYCSPEDPGPGPSDDYSTYIVLDPQIPANVMNSYVAHEFNHSLQFAYTASAEGILYEATATFMEDKVFDDINDYVYFTNDFLNKPERNFSFFSYNADSAQYGAAVFMHYLSDAYDAGATTKVRDLWDISEGAGDWFDAVEDVVPGNDDVRAIYAEFAGYRWLSGSNSDGWSNEASLWIRSPKIATHDLTENGGGDSPKPPMKLGANYIEVLAAGGASGDKLTLTLDGDSATEWAVTMIQQPPTGRATITVINDEDGDGKIAAASSDNGDYEKVVFAVVNIGPAGAAPDNGNGASTHTIDLDPSNFSYSLFYSATGGDPSTDEPIGCGCSKTGTPATPGALFAGFFGAAAMLVIKRRRD